MSFEKKVCSKKTYQKNAGVSYKARRGKLKPLMSEEAKSSANIQDLSYDFACRITRLCQWLNDYLKIGNPDWKNIEVLEIQLQRCGTSIGANVRESNHAQSAADFLSKMQIALKEADESEYWINLMHDNGYIEELAYNSIHQDIERILKVLTSIVGTTAKKIKESKSK